jgi:hypothetical protein
MSPLRLLLAIPRLVHARRVGRRNIWVSETWLEEHRMKEFDIGRRWEAATNLSTLVSERLNLVPKGE